MTIKKALFCGLGSIGQRHLRNLRALMGNDIEILAYRQRGGGPVLNADMTVQKDVNLETVYNIRSFTSLDDALNEQPDVVFITNPNSLHLPVALAAAHAGAHLFIEKPVSHSLVGLEDLVTIVEQKKLTAFVAYQFRFHPGIQWIKNKVQSGALGQLAAAHIVNGEYLPDWHPWEDYRNTHPARRDLGGGSLRIQTHELDYALWLFGMPDRVFALGGHTSRLEIDVEDSVSILMSCRQDGREYPVHVHLDYIQRPPQRVCEIIGDRGKLRYDYYANRIDLDDLKSRTTESFGFGRFERNQMFLDELSHFLSCVRGEQESLVDLPEGIRSLKISLAAADSLESSEVQKLQ